MKTGESDHAEQMIQVLSEYYKESLSAGREEITIREDLEITKNYIAVQMMRFMEQCDVEYDIDESLLNIIIPKLTLQPLVENCFVHGVIPCKYFCTIRIRIFGDDENVYIDISDDGVGMSQEKLEAIRERILHPAETEKHGIGITNTVTRLQMYFGAEDVFKIESEPQAGTRYCICISNSSRHNMLES